jgi:hypothetical protein
MVIISYKNKSVNRFEKKNILEGSNLKTIQ